MTIGVIGLGNMGSAVAANLLKSGQQVLVWNRSPAPVEALVAKGAKAAGDPAEVLRADVSFSMLAEDRVVEEVLLTPGRLEAIPEGVAHVNLATISVALADRLEAAFRDRGASYVAAPVLGRPDVAAQGQLHVLLAGAPEAAAKVRPVIELFAKAVWPLGDQASRANVVKLACNFAIASTIETLGEAGALAKAYGVEPAALYEVMTGTLFGSPVCKTYARIIAEGRFSPAGFAMPLGLKDVRLALQAGEARHAPLPLASVLRDQFIEAIAMGDRDKDWAALSQLCLRKAGLAVS